MTSAPDAALFASIWLSLVLFVAGEVGKRDHIVLAFDVRHGWNYGAAVQATAHQTDQVYGVAWGGGLYINFLFLTTWLLELFWWRLRPHRYFGRPVFVTWLLRTFYLVILLNAAIIFAARERQVLGLILLGILLWIWRPIAARVPAGG
jgi:hypothetical protein